MDLKDNEEIRNVIATYPSWSFDTGPLQAVDLTAAGSQLTFRFYELDAAERWQEATDPVPI